MNRLIEKFCKWTIDRAKRRSRLGATVWVWFPNVKKAFKMRISSFRVTFITARFIDPNDYDKSRVDVDFGQVDNDVVLDATTYLPAYKG